MKKKLFVIIMSIILLVIGVFITLLIVNKEKDEIDDNILYSERFGNTIIKFRRYDYVMGQRMLVGVSKSIDKGKTYTEVTEEPITVSNEAKFLFLDESLGFVISTGYVMRSNGFIDFKVTQDGGNTFESSKFNYNNDRVDLITIEDFPYYDGDSLKLRCSVYDINPDGDGYQDIEIIFSSNDNGLTWDYEK